MWAVPIDVGVKGISYNRLETHHRQRFQYGFLRRCFHRYALCVRSSCSAKILYWLTGGRFYSHPMNVSIIGLREVILPYSSQRVAAFLWVWQSTRLARPFPNHLIRLLVLPDPKKDRLSESIIPRPFRKFNLANHHRLDPVATRRDRATSSPAPSKPKHHRTQERGMSIGF